MKRFDSFTFNRHRCEEELAAFGELLSKKEHLREREDILPFFRKHTHLAAFIGSFNPNICTFDRVATEFNLFGDYACDLAVGDSITNNYCFVEFEDALPTSIFVKKKGKHTREWSPRFDHGFSQIIDWFMMLEDQRRTDLFRSRFDADRIQYVGLLVIGRRNGLDGVDRDRLVARSEQVRIGIRQVHCVTFDDLHDALKLKLQVMAG